ncbi:MAG: hypothetical protein J6S26_01890 [Solobacterium sp.]|nr:hypothetical protein [Solobacterium sp.]
MSCWREQRVLRLPAASIGIHSEEEWQKFEAEHQDVFCYEVRHFAPALCSSEHGCFLDYVLLDEERECGDGRETPLARSLSEDEIRTYLPVFRKLFPYFTEEHMKDVHYCSYIWYDGIDAPDCY